MGAYKWVKVNGRVMNTHREIMERRIGRRLKYNEVVHHKNGDTSDNRIENLEMMSRSEHSKVHRVAPTLKIMICSVCGCEYQMRLSIHKYRWKQGTRKFTCSKRCLGKMNSKYFPSKQHEEEHRRNVQTGMKKGWSGYRISKVYKMNKQTVYNHLKKLRKPRGVGVKPSRF